MSKIKSTLEAGLYSEAVEAFCFCVSIQVVNKLMGLRHYHLEFTLSLDFQVVLVAVTKT